MKVIVPKQLIDFFIKSREIQRFFSDIQRQLNSGVSGTFTTVDGKTVTVVDGIITLIEGP